MAHEEDDISREADALTAAYRRRAEPPPGAAARSWQALAARIDAGERDPLADRPRHAPAPRWRPWILGLAAAAALLLAVGLSSRTAEQRGLADALSAAFQRVWSPAQATAVQPPRASDDAADAAPSPAPPPTAPDLVPLPPALPDRSPETGPSGQPGSDLARQLTQVRAAAEAVRIGDGPAALTAADAYLRAHPTGTFAPEARLHRAAALCLLGQTDAARDAAAAFARDYPTSPLRARVAAVCNP